MELVHETVNIKGWDICGSLGWGEDVIFMDTLEKLR